MRAVTLIPLVLLACKTTPTKTTPTKTTPTTPPVDLDQDGHTDDVDCDDNDPSVYPGADEGCDGIDTDCDGAPGADEIDADSDGLASCEGDCDDHNASISPNQNEVCNGIDDDCDTLIDAWDGVDCAIDVRDGSPFASPGGVNGGGIAAHDGTVYVMEYPGVSGFGGVVHLYERSGASSVDWITGAIAGLQPAISASGTLLVAGNWNDGGVYPNVLHCIVEEYGLTGQLVRTVLDETGPGCTWIGYIAEAPDGSATYLTDSDAVRELIGPAETSLVDSGVYGGHVAVQADGTILTTQSGVLGVVGPSGFEPAWTPPGSTWITSIAVAGGDQVVVSTDGPWWDPACFVPPCIGEILAFSPDLSSHVTLATTPGDGTFGGFTSMGYDRVGNEVVVFEDGDLYAIPGP